jgi:tetratricopeptide (TPR) repeat protein
MYLSLLLALGSMLAVTLPVMASDRVVMEQGLGVVGDRSPQAKMDLSPELTISQQPLNSPITKELRDLILNDLPEEILKKACEIRTQGKISNCTSVTFQEEIDQQILQANQFHTQRNYFSESHRFTVIGALYLRKGVPRKGLPYLESSLKIAQNINDPFLQYFALSNLGNSYRALGEYQKARETYHQSINTFSKLLKVDKNYTFFLISNLSGLANISDDLGETKEGLKYLTQAL